MKIKVHSRTAGELDWQRCVLDLHRLPTINEFIAIRPDDGSEALWHQVQVVVHVPSGSEWEAEVFCTKCGPNHPRRIAYSSTMPQPASTEERDGQGMEALDCSQEPKLLNESQAAEVAGVNRQTIRRLINTKRLPAADYGTERHLYRIHIDDLTRVMKDPSALVPLTRHQQIAAVPAPLKPYRPNSQSHLAAAAYLPAGWTNPVPSKRLVGKRKNK